MGIRNWFGRRHEDDDDAAVRTAEDERRAGSPEEDEAIRGDMEGLAADRGAEARFGESSVRDINRIGDF
jgi:hypothetical protein